MRAAVLPDYSSALEIRDLPVPDPGPGQVLVRVAGAGLCHSDLHIVDGELAGMPPSFPFVLGHEISGWVEASGPGVEGLAYNDPVAVFGGWGCGRCRDCLGGDEQLCLDLAAPGIKAPGGFAEFVLVPSSRHLVPLGDLDPVSSATFTDAALTSYRAVRKGLSRLVPGASAVVIGAGGLGQFAIQLVRALSPAAVVVVEPAKSHADLALELGADRVVSPDDDGALAAEAKRAAVVLDFVGSDATLRTATQLVAPRGRVVVVGVAGGSVPVSFFSPGGEADVTTSTWGNRNELADVVALAAAGRITARVHEVDLAGVNTALADLRAGHVESRIVLVP